MRHEHGIKARARMLRVIDGDTVEVIVQYPVKIRLRNCWAPELHGDDKIAGQRAKEAVTPHIYDLKILGEYKQGEKYL